MKKLKKNRGITLIALIITIIVLLILTGVSISVLVDDNGVIKQAQNASIKHKKENLKEKISMAVFSTINVENGHIEKDFTVDSIRNALNKEIETSETFSIYEIGFEEIFISFEKSQADFIIEKSGEILDLTQIQDETPGELSGNGTTSSPFLIESVEDFIKFLDEISNDNTYDNKYIKLECDLNLYSNLSYINPDLQNFCSYNGNLKKALTINNEFVGSDGEFKGHFDGNNKIIYGVNCKSDYSIFKTNSGEIKNLEIRGIFLNDTSIGAICRANSTSGIINNCKVKSTINTNNNSGGITGYNAGTIQNCTFTGSLTGNGPTIGGIVGYNHNGTVHLCSNYATIINNQINNTGNTGGIIGSNTGTVSNSTNYGTITAHSDASAGISGINYGTIKNCYNNADISGLNSCGGIVGFSTGNSCMIKNCYNLGNITFQGALGRCGGISGFARGTIENCKSISTITSSNYLNVGGIIGIKESSETTITNCEYNPFNQEYTCLEGTYNPNISMPSIESVISSNS